MHTCTRTHAHTHAHMHACTMYERTHAPHIRRWTPASDARPAPGDVAVPVHAGNHDQDDEYHEGGPDDDDDNDDDDDSERGSVSDLSEVALGTGAQLDSEAGQPSIDPLPPAAPPPPDRAWSLAGRRGPIDVYWLIDDGGLTVLLPVLIRTSKMWRGCPLRIFTVGQEDNESVLSLLHRFRIIAEVLPLTDLDQAPDSLQAWSLHTHTKPDSGMPPAADHTDQCVQTNSMRN